MVLALILQDSLLLPPSDTVKVFLVSENQGELWLRLLPLIIAGLAVFFGPLLQWYSGKLQMDTQRQIAQEQLRATVRSSNRQEWIRILREQLSDFVSQLGALFLNLRKGGEPVDAQFHREKTERLLFIQTKIQLLLNPNKPEQKEIIELVDEARKAAISKELARLEIFIKEITEKSQALIKLTWEEIKNLE